MNKFITILVLASFGSAIVSAQSNHFQWGIINSNDVRLHYEIVQKSSSILQIVTKDITFPGNGTANYRQITGIRAQDQYINGNGGYVSLLDGGVTFSTVTLHFKSQRGHGFNFILEIFTR